MRRKYSQQMNRVMTNLSGQTACVCLLTIAQSALANPQGGSVIQGDASITHTGTTTTIVQTSAKAIINWQDFSINNGETTQFKQPSASAYTLNRVTGNNASQIMGSLKSNGNIYLINPNGILFGKSAKVDVGGLVVSTANISDQDFMQSQMHKFSNAPSGSYIINEGSISIKTAGLAVLVAPQVVNQGVIQANLGTVAIASADHFTLDLYGDNLISFDTGKVLSKGQIEQAGMISANGGAVLLSAQAASDILRNTINMTGVIEAKSVSSKNGKVVLQGYDNSTIKISGQVDVSGQHVNETGGLAQLSADNIYLQQGSVIDASGYNAGGNIHVGSDVFHNPSDNPYINTQGLPAALRTAKTVYVESDSNINADSMHTGNAGNVVVWGDQTTWFHGNISAAARGLNGDGGRIETSGHYLDVAGIKIDASSLYGKTGLWLLDPADITVSQTLPTTNGSFSGGNPNTFTPTTTATIKGSDISTALATANVIISTGNGVSNNNITFDTTFDGTNPITWSSANSLTFLATGNITINASASTSRIINPTNATSTSTINFRSDSNSDGVGTVTYTNGKINKGGAGNVAVNLYYNPAVDFATAPTDFSALVTGGATQTGYFLVHNNVAGRTVANIGASATTLSRSYAMSQDMTPNATNTLASFTAIGTAATPFTGIFTGANYTGTNYTISGLVIPATAIQYQGLFGNVSGAGARLDNITLINPSVTSAYNNSAGAVGGIAGIVQGGATLSGDFLINAISGATVVISTSTLGAQIGGIIGNLAATGIVTSGSTFTTKLSGGTFNVAGRVQNIGGIFGAVSGATSSANDFAAASLINNATVTGSSTLTGIGGIFGSFSKEGLTVTANMINNGSILRSAGNITSIGGIFGLLTATTTQSAFSGDMSNHGAVGGTLGTLLNVGGIIGGMTGVGAVMSGSMINAADVTGVNLVGGLIGNFSGGTISGTNANLFQTTSGIISGASSVGGLIGSLGPSSSFTRTGTTNIGTSGGVVVRGTATNSSNIGGLFGTVLSTATNFTSGDLTNRATVNTTQTTGTVTGIGGIFGNFSLSGMTVTANMLNTGLIYAGDIGSSTLNASSSRLGGIFGIITASTFTGSMISSNSVQGGSDVGGLIGRIAGAIVSGSTDFKLMSNSANITIGGNTTGSNIGGLVGIANTGSFIRTGIIMTDLTGGGSISVTHNSVTNMGGLFGSVTTFTLQPCLATSSCVLENYATVTANGGSNVGGIFGTQSSLSNLNQTADMINHANITINGTGDSAGGIFGYTQGIGVNYSGNLYNYGSVSAASNVGGIAGATNSATMSGNKTVGDGSSTPLTLTLSSATGTGLGGIVGNADSNPASNTSITTGTTTLNSNVSFVAPAGSSSIGGVIGIATSNVSLSGVFNLVPINVLGDAVGGYIGSLSGSTNLTGNINNTVSVSGRNNVGGVIGYAMNGPALVNRIFGSISNSGTINGTDSVGGVIGKVERASFQLGSSLGNSGAVTGVRNVGGLIGNMSNAGGVGAIVYSISSASEFTNSGTITGTGAVNTIGGIFGGFTATLALTNSFTNSGSVISTNIGAFGTGGIMGDLGSNVSFSRTLKNNGMVTGAGSNIGGLFGHLTNANLSSGTLSLVAGGTVGGTGTNIGGMIGLIDDASVLPSTLTTTSTMTGSGINVGGVIGQSAVSLSNTLTHTTGAVAGSDSVGAIIGLLNGGTLSGTLTGSVNVTATNNAGGLVGQLNNGILSGTLSYSSGTVNGGSGSGGFVGHMINTSSINLTSATFGGTLSGSGNVGGIVGIAENSPTFTGTFSLSGLTVTSTATNVGAWIGSLLNATLGGTYTNTTALTANNSTNVGGFFGAAQNSTVAASLNNTVNISGNSTVGGLIGNLMSGSIFTGSMINSSNVQGANSIGGLIGALTGGTLSGSNDFKLSSNGADLIIGGAMTGDNVGGLIGNASSGVFSRTGMITTDISGGGSISIIHNSVSNMGGLFGSVTDVNFQPCSSTPGCLLENHATLTATGGSQIGGIFGSMGATLNLNNTVDMVNYGQITVNGSGSHAGGIFGSVTGTGVNYSGNLSNYGNVVAAGNVGGIGGVINAVTLSGNKIVGDGSATPLTLTLSSASGSGLGGIAGKFGVNGVISGTSTLNSNVVLVAPSGSVAIGGVAGQLDQTGTLSGTFNLIPINVLGDEVGGYIGEMNGNATLIGNINNTMNISGGNAVGGIIGKMSSGSAVQNLVSGTFTNSGNISGTNNIGGLIGAVDLGTFDGSAQFTNSGYVTGVNNVGGFIGDLESGTLQSVYNVMNNSVTGSGNNTGGLVGKLGSGATLQNALFGGSITGNIAVGGLVGLNQGTILNSLGVGSVSGTSQVGALVGNNIGTLNSVIYSTDLSSTAVGAGSSVGVVAGNAYAMSASAFYTSKGWNFTTIWMQQAGYYPSLQWCGTDCRVAIIYPPIPPSPTPPNIITTSNIIEQQIVNGILANNPALTDYSITLDPRDTVGSGISLSSILKLFPNNEMLKPRIAMLPQWILNQTVVLSDQANQDLTNIPRDATKVANILDVLITHYHNTH